MNRTLVSFCLFGPDSSDIYYSGALRNCEWYLRYAPECFLRFYAARNSGNDVLDLIAEFPNAEIVQMDGPEDQSATFWRFLSLKEPDWDFYLFRDVDSRPILRERLAVEDWMASDRDFHVMRDHHYHSTPILAGLWGVRGRMGQKVGRILPRGFRQNYYQVDQIYLKNFIWPMARRSVLAHVDCEWTYGTKTHEFRADLSEGFCGQGFYGDGTPRIPKDIRPGFRGLGCTAEEIDQPIRLRS